MSLDFSDSERNVGNLVASQSALEGLLLGLFEAVMLREHAAGRTATDLVDGVETFAKAHLDMATPADLQALAGEHQAVILRGFRAMAANMDKQGNG